jgi:hypothetical protein
VFANLDYLTLPTCTSTEESGPPAAITACSPTPNFDVSTSAPQVGTVLHQGADASKMSQQELAA